MPGFVSSISNSNEAVFANNADFSGSTDPTELNGLQTDGDLWIGSTAVNAGGTHINVGNITSPLGTLTVGYTSPDITLDVASTPGTTAIFSAYLSSTQSNVTGDGTIYTIPFDTALVNLGAAYNTGTGVFTAPTTGNYMFSTTVSLSGLLTGHIEGIYSLNGSNYENRFFQSNFGAMSVAGVLSASGSFTIPMTAGQTMSVFAFVNSGAKVVDVVGAGAPATYTNFSGYLIP